MKVSQVDNEFDRNSQTFIDSEGHSYYDLLEIPRDSSRMQIREAYIRLKNTYSNSNQALYSLLTPEETQSSLDALEEAYRVLYDEQRRKEYDDALNGLTKTQDTVDIDPFATSSQPQYMGHVATKGATTSDTAEIWSDHEPTSVRGETAKKMRFSGAALCDETQENISKIIEESEVIDGSFLKKLRDSQRVSLHELQDRTKVSLQYIIAMENNDFKSLPSVVYVKGFLKILLQYMGVKKNEAWIIQQYLECLRHWQISNGKELY